LFFGRAARPSSSSNGISQQQQQQQRRLRLPSSASISTATLTSTALHGIPRMFRWLTDQYPDILNRQLEEEGLDADIDVDSLYLDMNGIIHPCTHGNNDRGGEVIVLDETAMFKKIFLYVDRCVYIVSCRVVCVPALHAVTVCLCVCVFVGDVFQCSPPPPPVISHCVRDGWTRRRTKMGAKEHTRQDRIYS
jgi:XRN 5'-3' exonuclease N-terminus